MAKLKTSIRTTSEPTKPEGKTVDLYTRRWGVESLGKPTNRSPNQDFQRRRGKDRAGREIKGKKKKKKRMGNQKFNCNYFLNLINHFLSEYIEGWWLGNNLNHKLVSHVPSWKTRGGCAPGTVEWKTMEQMDELLDIKYKHMNTWRSWSKNQRNEQVLMRWKTPQRFSAFQPTEKLSGKTCVNSMEAGV